MYLNWEGAVGKEELRQLPGPFRVRRAHDLGWKPGFVVAVGVGHGVGGSGDAGGFGAVVRVCTVTVSPRSRPVTSTTSISVTGRPCQVRPPGPTCTPTRYART
jgi:hypothetical protein